MIAMKTCDLFNFVTDLADPSADAGRGFHYYFPNSPEASRDTSMHTRLGKLAQAFRGTEGLQISDALTSLSRFIEHDLIGKRDQTVDNLTSRSRQNGPAPRGKVIHTISNQRSGAVDLDTVYGGSARYAGMGKKLTQFLRHPRDAGKVVVGDLRHEPLNSRLTTSMSPHHPGTDNCNVKTIRDLFFQVDDSGTLCVPHSTRAVAIGLETRQEIDIATLQTLFLRLHNRIVDLHPQDTRHGPDGNALYLWARDRVRWQYQWLIVNDYLRQICHGETLDQILLDEAPLYRDLASAVPVDPQGRLPIPLEFSAAAFGFAGSDGAKTQLHLGYGLNLPSAQSCLAGISHEARLNLQVLSHEQLTFGRTGQALAQLGLAQDTPLWFYLQKEAEILGRGKTLGPLGTSLVANTLLGLMVMDDTSYWNQSSVHGARWNSMDGIANMGHEFNSFAALQEMMG